MIGEPHEIFGETAKRLCVEVAQQVVEEARPLAEAVTKSKTGKLANGYEAIPYEDGAAITNPAAPYWSFVEFGHNVVTETGEVVGHVGQRAHVRPAIEAVRKLRSE